MSRERVLQFGPSGRLIGILCEPIDATLGRSKPAVLLSNVGVSHRVGPFRLNVHLARRLAAQGYYSLRFDFAGLGDSEASPDGGSETDRAIAEASAAMDLITVRTGIDRFVMMGLCSGADKTHIVATTDQRIVGAAFIDGYAFTTWRFNCRRLTLRLLELKRIKVYIKHRWKDLQRRLLRLPKPSQAYEPTVIQPPREQAEADLLAMAQRGVKQLHLYTISVDTVYNYADQFWHMYPALRPHRASIISERYPQVDHTLSIVAMQKIIVERLCTWIGLV